ncbi:MAG: ComEC/Rec2 family competence protein [Lentisphaeraceae bacterium]|nr:ComEC/Rec2 family competence protein [Lentisphaeraceae bacterium]
MTFLERLFDSSAGLCRHRPLYGWAVAIILGTALGFFAGLPWVWLVGATGVVVRIWWRPNYSAVQLSCLLWFVLLLLTAWRAGLYHDRNAAVLARLREQQTLGNTFPLVVTVSNDRQIVPRKRGGPYCRFSVDNAWFADGTAVHGANLRVFYYDRTGNFPQVGERWRLQVKPRRGVPLYRLSLSARGETAERLAEGGGAERAQYWLAGARERLAEHLALGVEREEALLLQTMLLGRRTTMPYAARQRYADAGIIHIFAISGLHVGIVAGFLIWVLAALGVRLRWRALVLAPALVGYLLLTGIPPSAARACTMAILYCLAPTVLRQASAPAALFATAAGVLLIEPGWVANVGAILSFTVMGGILLCMEPLKGILVKWLRAEVPERDPGELPAPLSWHVRLRQHVASLVALTLSAWLAAAPLSLYFFGRLSLVGLVLNLLIPGLTLAIVWCACVSAVAGFCVAPISVLCNRAGVALLRVLDLCSEVALSLPGSTVELAPMERPGITVTLLLEFALLLFGLWLRVRSLRLR